MIIEHDHVKDRQISSSKDDTLSSDVVFHGGSFGKGLGGVGTQNRCVCHKKLKMFFYGGVGGLVNGRFGGRVVE